MDIVRSGQMTAEQERKYKQLKERRAMRLAELLKTTEVDWEGSIQKVDSLEEAESAHLDDAWTKLRAEDWR